MWKENLPDNCPPSTAKEMKIEAFRILKDNVPVEEDFITYSRLYPNNIRYQSLCKAHAISFYDTFENAKIALKAAINRGNDIGKFIGKYEIKEVHGKNEYTSSTGHYSIWFYGTWDVKDFNPSFVEEIDGN